MHLTLEKKVLATSTILALLMLLVVGAIIWPTVSQIYTIDMETAALRASMQAKYERIINLRETLKRVAELKVEAASYGDYIFHHGDELKLITSLENIAGKNGVAQKITSSNIDQITNQHIQLSLTVVGAYTSVLQFLADLENQPYFISLNRIELTTADHTPGATAPASNVQANLDLSLYVAN